MITDRSTDPRDVPMIEMAGVIHSLVAIESGGVGSRWPVMLIANSKGQEATVLLDQEDIDALHEFLGRYAETEERDQ